MVFGPGLTELTTPQTDVWVWQLVCMQSLSQQSVPGRTCKSPFLFYISFLGGIFHSDYERAGVQSSCRRQFAHSRAEPVSQYQVVSKSQTLSLSTNYWIKSVESELSRVSSVVLHAVTFSVVDTSGRDLRGLSPWL